MQENRPFDHYYGVLSGVRGYNDPAAPELPNGDSVFRQPVLHNPLANALCGCWDYCDLHWTPAGAATMEGLLKGMSCAGFADVVGSAIPPVAIKDGMTCAALLVGLEAMTEVNHVPLNFTEFITPSSTCSATNVVSGLPERRRRRLTDPIDAWDAAAAADDGDDALAGFVKIPNTDEYTHDLKQVTGGATPEQLAEACDATHGCEAFNSNGWLKTSAGSRRSMRDCDLYVRKNATYMLPFHVSFNKTSATCMAAPEMDYPCDIKMWANGSMDAWNTARGPGMGMAHFNRSDLPYYYALADAFTIGDQYFQSTFTATTPNRMHLFSGSNGLSVNATCGPCPILDDSEPKTGINWTTMGEVLEAANVSWKVYMGQDNFDDNGFAWFENYRNAKPGSPLYDKGMARIGKPGELYAFVDKLAEDVANDALPQVSWLVGPMTLSEHASNHPQSGEDLTHRIVSVFADPKNRDVYAKTALILNYDEGGQFFDHHWPPTPPTGTVTGLNDGKSTVTVRGEVTTSTQHGVPAGHPIGMGFRVPFMVVSPWTRGGYVYSEVADHTSVCKFVEKRFGVHLPTISPWRRAVAGDLMGAFDFEHPDLSWPASFPVTKNNVAVSHEQCIDNPPPEVPAKQGMPHQEPGTRPARALPYRFEVTDAVAGPGASQGRGRGRSGTSGSSGSSGAVTVRIANKGIAGAAFIVFDRAQGTRPRKYAVEAGKALADTWELNALARGAYNLSLHGPNGFVRRFAGTAPPPPAASTSTRRALLTASLGYAFDARARDDADTAAVLQLGVTTTGGGGGAAQRCTFVVTDDAYGAGPWEVQSGGPHAPYVRTVAHRVPVGAHGNWYALTVTAPGCDPSFSRSFMGHVETGRATTSDPAIAAAAARAARADAAAPQRHLRVPAEFRAGFPWTLPDSCKTRRGRLKVKDACVRLDKDEL